jgi:hypothetical protein
MNNGFRPVLIRVDPWWRPLAPSGSATSTLFAVKSSAFSSLGIVPRYASGSVFSMRSVIKSGFRVGTDRQAVRWHTTVKKVASDLRSLRGLLLRLPCSGFLSVRSVSSAVKSALHPRLFAVIRGYSRLIAPNRGKNFSGGSGGVRACPAVSSGSVCPHPDVSGSPRPPWLNQVQPNRNPAATDRNYLHHVAPGCS